MIINELNDACLDFLQFVTSDDRITEDNLIKTKGLLLRLDKLAVAMHRLPAYDFDDREYPDPPEMDYQKIYNKLEERFAGYSYYTRVYTPLNSLETQDIFIEYPIDDIADIYQDISKSFWCIDNTSLPDGLWHLEFDYSTHWGRHLRNLQSYLHAKLCES